MLDCTYNIVNVMGFQSINKQFQVWFMNVNSHECNNFHWHSLLYSLFFQEATTLKNATFLVGG